jgi:hypothetical protein
MPLRDCGDFADRGEPDALTWTLVMAMAAILAVALALAILVAVALVFERTRWLATTASINALSRTTEQDGTYTNHSNYDCDAGDPK